MAQNNNRFTLEEFNAPFWKVDEADTPSPDDLRLKKSLEVVSEELKGILPIFTAG